jgi:hypothetical protein
LHDESARIGHCDTEEGSYQGDSEASTKENPRMGQAMSEPLTHARRGSASTVPPPAAPYSLSTSKIPTPKSETYFRKILHTQKFRDLYNPCVSVRGLASLWGRVSRFTRPTGDAYCSRKPTRIRACIGLVRSDEDWWELERAVTLAYSEIV